MLTILVFAAHAARAQERPAALEAPAWKATVQRGQIVALTHRQSGFRAVVSSGAAAAPGGLNRQGEAEFSLGQAAVQMRAGKDFVEQTAEWKDANGVRRARLSTRFAATPNGDMTVTQKGETAAGGLYAASWGIGDIPDTLDLLVPGNSGQRFAADSPRTTRVFEYPISWEAPFVLIQGPKGGFLVRAEDPDSRFKNLTVQHVGHNFRLRLESRSPAPFDDKTRIVSSRWRITAYSGGWQNGAALYRRRLQSRFPAIPVAKKSPAWARDIRFVVIMELNVPLLADLAKRCNPKQTLLYLPGWRKSGYDRNYPDYTAVPEFGAFAEAAHRLGFRVMPHVNYFGCDPKNPLYAEFRQYQMRDSLSKELLWWDWQRADPPIKFAYINPASKKWRKLFVSRMTEFCRRYHIDAIHLDQTLCIFNDANGPIDGMNCIEGNLALHRDLRAALPEVALSGEGLDEVTCVYEAFAQRHLWGFNHADGTWDDRTIARSHPISSAILTPYTQIYGYLGMSNPGSAAAFTAWRQGYEHFGVLPTYPWPDAAQLKAPTFAMQETLEMARFFQRGRPVPDFTTPWRKDDLFVYRLADGRRASFRKEAGVVFGVEAKNGKETILSRRLEGVASARIAGSVSDWPAYNASEIVGLDPARSYAWSPRPRDLKALHLEQIPAGYTLTRCGIGPEFARFRLEPTAASDRNLMRLWDFRGPARSGVKLSTGVTHAAEGVECLDDTGGTVLLEGANFFMHPPWKGEVAAPITGVTFVEFTVDVPDAAQATLESAVVLKPDAVGKSDGETFRLTATGDDGTARIEANQTTGTPTPMNLDLTRFRGKRVTVRMEASPGPKNDPSFDWGLWAQPRIVLREAANTALRTLRIADAGGVTQALVAEGEAQWSTPSAGMLEVRCSLPNTVTLPIGPPEEVKALPFDLLHAKAISRVLFVDGIERPSYSFFAGVPGEAACGGKTLPALNQHPPPNGQTLVDYVLRLPNAPVWLKTWIGLCDGNKSNGVGFRIEIDGKEVFSRRVDHGASGWSPVSVDLSPWHGKPVVLTLITDSLGDYDFDWAAWAEPQLVGRP